MSVLDILPKSVRGRYRQSAFCKASSAKSLARSIKRLDLCAAQIAHLLHLSGISSVEGKVCLEVGSGWVLSHAVIFYLLGAKKVIATDILPWAYPPALKVAIQNAVSYIVRDVLSPFAAHHEIRARLDRLLSIPEFSFELLREMGIEYVAPVNWAKKPLETCVDLVYSLSVLEEVLADELGNLLGNLEQGLNEGGVMVHAVHIDDKGSVGLQRDDWFEVFNEVNNLDWRILYQWQRGENRPEIRKAGVSNQERGVSHMGILCTKK